jgi:uncharacterized protein (DUF58 family)
VIGSLVRLYEDRFTFRGRALLWFLLASALLGLDTRRTQVFKLFAWAAAALAAAWAISLLRRPRVRLDCALPARATAGTPVSVRVRATGERRGADLRLHFPRPLRWGGSIRYEPQEAFLTLGPDATAEAVVDLRAERRGRYVLRGPTLSTTDPLRLTAGRGCGLEDHTLLAYPRFARLEAFDIPLGRRYQPGGIPLSSNTGDAIEFVGTREYREGDPLRSIHWRSWARRGEPVVKEFQEEYFCRIALVLDTFLPARPTPAQTASFEAAISVLASIADVFSRSEYIVDILAAGPDIYEVSAGRSLAYLENILDVLACLEPCHEPPFRTIGPHLFEKLAQITTVVALLQDWDEDREAFLRRVKSLGTAVRTLVIHEGETAREWHSAALDLGVEQRTPGEIEAAITAEGSHGE